MPLPVFEHAYLLQSLGWAIAHSFWQIGSLWLVYQCITSLDKKLPALVKYHLSIVLLITSFTWFIFTILENYRSISNSFASPGIFPGKELILRLSPFNSALPILSIVYLLSLCFYAARFVKNMSANRFLKTTGLTRAPVDFRLFTTNTALRLGIKKKIQVWISAHVDVPSVTGFVKPVILLPAAIINQLSIQQTEAILLHELAHIKRNDYLVNFLQSIVELILFFNPFAILLGKAARKERENCCDDWVMNFQYDHYEYARALLVLEEQRHLLQFRFALTATNGKKNLLQRVKRLFIADPQTNFSSLQKLKFMGLCFLLLAGIFTLLPRMINKPVLDDTVVVPIKKEQLKLVKSENLYKENAIRNTFRAQPPKSTKQDRPVAKNRKSKKPRLNTPTLDYVNALVNEELLNPLHPIEPVLSQVVDKEIKNLKYLVKIEEQQSGKKQTNTYYFELNNKDGNTAIKPLMMLNKIKISVKKNVLIHLPDSCTSTKPDIKRRITS